MKSLLLLIVLMTSSTGFAGQQYVGMTLKSATIAADRIAYQWLKNHDEAFLELNGQVKNSWHIHTLANTTRINEFLTFRVCYRKLEKGEIKYCYELNRSHETSRRLN
jgi:hypothetical protein